MPTATVENYLKAMLALGDERDQVSVSALSRSLGVSTPTANAMTKRLNERGWVNYERYKPLSLTDRGRVEAAQVVRKHRLTEMFLVERMGFGWEEVHAIAEQIEHVHSPAFFERMDRILGSPTVDPHGSPIPDREGNITRSPHIRLLDCTAGDSVRLVALAHSSAELLQFLNARELSLGVELRVHSIEPFDQSREVCYGEHKRATLSREVSESLLVAHL